jgi:hypothetical protein
MTHLEKRTTSRCQKKKKDHLQRWSNMRRVRRRSGSILKEEQH